MWRAPLALLLLAVAFAASPNAGPPRDGRGALTAQAPATSKLALPLNASQATEAEFATLLARLEHVSQGLSKVLTTGGLLKTKAGASVSIFEAELNRTLQVVRQAKGPQKEEGVKTLRGALRAVHALMDDLSVQQERLMKASMEQQEGLLMGVLLTRRGASRSEQMAILMHPDFATLPAVAAVLAANDSTTPLIQQLAKQMDRNQASTPANATAAKAVEVHLRGAANSTAAAPKEAKKVAAARVVAALEGQLGKLKEGLARQMKASAAESKRYAAAAESAQKKSPAAAQKLLAVKRARERRSAKLVALQQHDIASLQKAVEAIKAGDMKALLDAKSALEGSLRSMRARSGGFLYLLQTVRRAEGLDCPYCAAQCIDNCHSAGKPYSTCLTDCADAGK